MKDLDVLPIGRFTNYQYQRTSAAVRPPPVDKRTAQKNKNHSHLDFIDFLQLVWSGQDFSIWLRRGFYKVGGSADIGQLIDHKLLL